MGSIIAQRVWRQHPDPVGGLVLCATTDHFRIDGRERVFHAGMELAMVGAARRVSRSRTAVRAARVGRREALDLEPADIARLGAARSSAAPARGRSARPSPPSAGTTRGPGCRRSTCRPRWWSPTSDQVIPPDRQRRRWPRRIPGATVHDVDARPRRLRAGGRAFVPAFVEAVATVNARHRARDGLAASRAGLQLCFLAFVIGVDRRSSPTTAALQLLQLGREPLAPGRRRRGIDSRQAMTPTCIWPLLDITVMLRPAPWKTGPSG